MIIFLPVLLTVLVVTAVSLSSCPLKQAEIVR